MGAGGSWFQAQQAQGGCGPQSRGESFSKTEFGTREKRTGISASNHMAVRWREVPPAGQAQGQGLAGAGESWERGLLAESEGYELLTLFIPSTPSRLCHRHTRTPAFTARAFLPLFMCCLRNYTFYFNFKIYMSYIFMSHRYNKTF